MNSIFCYIYNDDNTILGFMSADNHCWDSDCFHAITTSLPFTEAMNKID